MWVHLQRTDFYEGTEPLPKAGTLIDEGVYALVRSRVELRERDGVELIPGRAPPKRQRPLYWVTGIVGAGIGPSGVTRTAGEQEFLLVAGGARFVARSVLSREDQVMVGERVSLVCTFELVAAHDWSALEVPSEWSGEWLVEQIVRVGSAARENYALDLVPVTG